MEGSFTKNKTLKVDEYTSSIISSSLQHKKNFDSFIQEMKGFKRDSTLHKNVTKRISDYLNLSSLYINEFDTKKIRKMKIREHMSAIKANIFAIAYYENMRSVNYKDRGNHMNLLFSLVNTPGFKSEVITQIFEIYNINFQSRIVRSIIVKPTMYVPVERNNRFEVIPYYDFLDNEEWIENNYTYNACSDFLNNYYSEPIYSSDFYNRATKLGFDFGFSYGYDIKVDIITRLLRYSKNIDKDTFEFIKLVFDNHYLSFNKEWISKLSDYYSKYLDNEKSVSQDLTEYSDKFLEMIGSKYSSWLDGLMNYWNLEYVLAPIMKVSGSNIFSSKRTKNKQMIEMMDKVINARYSSNYNSDFYKIRKLMLLEQLVKEMDEQTDYSKFIDKYKDIVIQLGKCKYSVLCELKKYAIRYGKENYFKDLDKINLNSPGYMQYSDDRKWMASRYSGPSVTLPILECDWNSEKSQILEYEPYQEEIDEFEDWENEKMYRERFKNYGNNFYDSD